MREILFRGKRIDNGEWEYGGCVFTENKVCLIYNQTHSIDLQGSTVEENSVGQFTGLTDKNGRKIFEGDIVKTSHGGSTYYAKIEWDDGSFWVTNHDIQMPSYISEVSKTYLEVIGNIHDNPDLLEENKWN